MAKVPPRPLPIVWYLNAADLRDRGCTPICYQLLVDAVERWQADGSKKLDELRDEIDNILYKKCP
jgi:hypothetical protein